MSNRISTILLLFFSFSFTLLKAQAKPQKFKVVGEIAGIKPGTWVSLIDVNTKDTLATALSKLVKKTSVFQLQGTITETALYTLHIQGLEPYNLFVEKGTTIITGNIGERDQWKVKGSSAQNDFIAFENTFTPLAISLSNNAKIINASAPGAYRDSLLNVYRGIQITIESKLDEYIAKRKKSFVSPLVLLSTMNFYENPIALNKRFQQLDEKVKASYMGEVLGEMLDNMLVGAIGTQALDFTQADTSGNPIHFASFRGKYVLIDFWASWCRPCRDENPNLVKAFHKFKDRNFDVLGVSLDRPGRKEDWLKAIRIDNLAWTQVSDLKFWDNEVARMYKVGSIPQNLLVDPNGIIIAKNLRGQDLEDKLCEILGGCN